MIVVGYMHFLVGICPVIVGELAKLHAITASFMITEFVAQVIRLSLLHNTHNFTTNKFNMIVLTIAVDMVSIPGYAALSPSWSHKTFTATTFTTRGHGYRASLGLMQ